MSPNPLFAVITLIDQPGMAGKVVKFLPSFITLIFTIISTASIQQLQFTAKICKSTQCFKSTKSLKVHPRKEKIKFQNLLACAVWQLVLSGVAYGAFNFFLNALYLIHVEVIGRKCQYSFERLLWLRNLRWRDSCQAQRGERYDWRPMPQAKYQVANCCCILYHYLWFEIGCCIQCRCGSQDKEKYLNWQSCILQVKSLFGLNEDS